MKQNQIIGDKYRVREVLGKGGTSTVYLAENIVLENLWAIKALSKSSEWFSAEMNEITILKGLSHPMLPRIVDLLEDEDYCYIVMDYISGSNLLEFLQMNCKAEESKLLLWTKSLLEVLEYLHSRNPPIVYRDLKPANLILDESGRIRLVDFGTASYHREEASEDTVYIGTQGYAAPEQYGLGRSDARTDLFNLGMTLIHLATGIHPLKIEQSAVARVLKEAGLSPKFIMLIKELIQTDPDLRPIDCKVSLKKLEQIISGRRTFFKLKSKEFKGEVRTVIGIASILPNTGLTSLCMMLGNYLRKHGLSTAITEMNPNRDYWDLCDAFEQADMLKSKKESCFEAMGISFYPEISDLSQVPRKKFNVTILDLGCIKSENSIRELNRADIKLVLCPSAVWKLPRIFGTLEQLQPQALNDWVYAVCSSQKTEEQIIKDLYKLSPVVTFPLASYPFTYSKDNDKRIGSALKKLSRGRFL